MSAPSSSIDFFSQRMAAAFPQLVGARMFEGDEVLEKLRALCSPPLHLSGRAPIWLMRADGSSPIERFAALDARRVLLSPREGVAERLFAHRSPAAPERDFVCLFFGADVPTGLYAPHGLDQEEFAVFEGRLLTTPQHCAGTVTVDGRTLDVSAAECRVRSLKPWVALVAAQLSPLHSARVDAERQQLLAALTAGKASPDDLVRATSTWPAHPLADAAAKGQLPWAV